jgi:isochorismate synthase
MQLSNRNAYLYAGAGVTEISDPEKEWEETNLKLETLLRVIRKSNGTDGN